MQVVNTGYKRCCSPSHVLARSPILMCFVGSSAGLVMTSHGRVFFMSSTSRVTQILAASSERSRAHALVKTTTSANELKGKAGAGVSR
jgi:hypothetical protein